LWYGHALDMIAAPDGSMARGLIELGTLMGRFDL
jgi:hypothetical protein